MENKGHNNLEVVKQYLQYGTFPKNCTKVDRRAARKRSKTFVFVDNQLYYTGGRPKRLATDNETPAPGNPSNDPDLNQTLRKCCTSEEEKQEVVMRCHIGDDGTHFGVDKTTDRVSREYYWVGITHSVRKTLRNCEYCIARGIRCAPSNPSFTIGSEENGIKMEADFQDEPDVFFVAQETCNYFWQRVELQVFGPFHAGRKSVYVAVALDCYSQFPEAIVLENISAISLTTFILNLICRYGAMEKLCLLQNKSTKDMYLYINLQDLEELGFSPTYLALHSNPADERWQRVSKHIEQFVRAYPKVWNHCLEACMVPLRISLPPQADYSPFYLTFNREPVFPEKLSHRNASFYNTELRMSETNEKETVNLLMTAYERQSKVAPIQSSEFEVSLDMLPTVKLEVLPPLSDSNVLNLQESRIVPLEFDIDQSTERDVGRESEGKNEIVYEEISSLPTELPAGFTCDDDDNGDVGFGDMDEDDADETYQPSIRTDDTDQNESRMVTRSSKRKRTLTFKAKDGLSFKKEKSSSLPAPTKAVQPVVKVKRKRGRPPKKRLEALLLDGDAADQASNETRESWAPALTNDGLMNSIELLDLDLYYLIIKSYKERNSYPPRVSVDFKRAVRRLAETVVLNDGKLYGHVGKASGRRLITRARERFCLLRKAHTKEEDHVSRVKVLKALMDMNIYWKSINLDLDAFVHGCPECVANNNPIRNKSVVRIRSQSEQLGSNKHEDLHMSEDEEEESSYEDLIQYLTDGTFPSTVSQLYQSRIKKRSESFCIISGSLYYKPHPDSHPRQVLFSEKKRTEAIQQAHIEGEIHLSQQETQAKLRQHFFWSGMTYDIMMNISVCCLSKALSVIPAEHQNPVIQDRVNKFRKYYAEGIPDLVKDTDAIFGKLPESKQTSSEIADTAEGKGSGETLETIIENEEHTPLVEAESRSIMEDQAIKKAVEAMIVKFGGEKNTMKNLRKPRGRPPAPAPPKPKEPLTPEQLRVQRAKAKHKCDHCGKIVKGDVAYKVHLYKHTGIKPFNCSVCGKAFSNRKSQRIHMRKHTGVRPYLCNQCGREFFRSASLRYHLKAHATGKGTPVTCDVCGRSFSTEHRLTRHKEFKHPAQVKVYMCNQCGKYFTAARSLKRHEQTHTGIRKYQCQYCTKAFFRKEYLNAHLSNHSEYDPELEKLKPRKKPSRKPVSQSTQGETVSVTTVVIPEPSGSNANIPSNVIHWTESSSQGVQHGSEEVTVTDLSPYQRRGAATSGVLGGPLRPNQTGSVSSTSSSTILSAANISHLPVSSSGGHSHPIHHHPLHHPLAQATRLMGPRGPVAVTLSAGGQPIEVVRAANGQEILLQHDSVPVQYEVECLPGEAHTLTEADLNAIHLLAQASITGQNLQSM